MNKYFKMAEELGWNVDVEKQDGRYCAEISQYSPAGEDFGFTIDYEMVEEIPEKINRCYNDFDVDEHVQMWIEAKNNGVGGVPSVVTLVHDAEEIEEMLEYLAINISCIPRSLSVSTNGN